MWYRVLAKAWTVCAAIGTHMFADTVFTLLPPLFPLGRVVATPAALDALRLNQMDPSKLLDRHAAGDWGTLSLMDRVANAQALCSDDRILSAYPLQRATDDADRVFVLTEGNREYTTVLLNSEY